MFLLYLETGVDVYRTDVIIAAHHLDVPVLEADGQHVVPLLLVALLLLLLLAVLALLHVKLLAVPGE